MIEVPKWHKASQSGLTHYATVSFSPGSDSRVPGTLLELIDAELGAADGYERDSEYVRVMATLTSSLRAWMYVSSSTVDSFRTAKE